MKSILKAIVICSLGLLLLTGCGSKVPDINSTIEKIQNGEVTQQELDTAISAYHSLKESEVSQVTDADLLLKYENVSLDNVKKVQAIADGLNNQSLVVDYVDLKEKYDGLNTNEQALIKTDIDLSKLNGIDASAIDKLNEDINNIGESTPFADILEIQKTYDGLTLNEKSFVKNYDKVSSKMELTTLEKAALGAVQTIRSVLKDKSSLKVYSIMAADGKDSKGKGYYYVYTKYSAANSFGANKDDTSLQTIDSDFKNPFIGLAQLTGTVSEAIYQSSFLDLWLKYKPQAEEIDVDKIMYFLDN